MGFAINACFLLAIALYYAGETSAKFTMTVKSDAGFKSPYPEVHGAKSCGGAAKFESFHLDGCVAGAQCVLKAGLTSTSDLVFIPSKDQTKIGHGLDLTVDGKTTNTIKEHIPDSEVKEGVKSYVRRAGFSIADLKGKTVSIKYWVYRDDADHTVETCVEAEVKVE